MCANSEGSCVTVRMRSRARDFAVRICGNHYRLSVFHMFNSGSKYIQRWKNFCSKHGLWVLVRTALSKLF